LVLYYYNVYVLYTYVKKSYFKLCKVGLLKTSTVQQKMALLLL